MINVFVGSVLISTFFVTGFINRVGDIFSGKLSREINFVRFFNKLKQNRIIFQSWTVMI